MKRAVNFWQNVKKANRIFLPVLFCVVVLSTAAFAQQPPSATFKKMWIDYDVTENSQKGMRIHAEFDVHNMKGISGLLSVFFQYSNGTFLRDNNNLFRASTGEVAVYAELNPGFNPTTWYQDLSVFMPYDELDLPAGKYDLKIFSQILYPKGGAIGTFPTYNIVFTQPEKTQPAKNPSATLGRVWVDYDVREGGQKGMRVHVKFTVEDMKGIDGKLAVYFQKKNGDYIYTSNTAFKATERSGQLALYFDISPGFQRTVYEDADVFLPYTALNLRGSHDLQMDIDVIHLDGDLITHLALEDFWFEKN